LSRRDRNIWVSRAILAVLLAMSVAGAAPVRDDYVYVEDLDRHYVLRVGDKRHLGQLDRAGNFIPHRVNATDGDLAFSGYPYQYLNFPMSKNGSKLADGVGAYEFRSGRLIPGKMMPDGNFIPDADGRIIRFEVYKHNPDGPQIWNLPGYFLRREKLEGRRKWLAEFLAAHPDDIASDRYWREKAKLDAAVEGKK